MVNRYEDAVSVAWPFGEPPWLSEGWPRPWLHEEFQPQRRSLARAATPNSNGLNAGVAIWLMTRWLCAPMTPSRRNRRAPTEAREEQGEGLLDDGALRHMEFVGQFGELPGAGVGEGSFDSHPGFRGN